MASTAVAQRPRRVCEAKKNPNVQLLMNFERVPAYRLHFHICFLRASATQTEFGLQLSLSPLLPISPDPPLSLVLSTA